MTKHVAENRVINPNFDITPNPRAVAQLTPTPELIASLAKADEAAPTHRTLGEVELGALDEQSCADLAGACAARANMYALLSRVYRVEVDREFLKQLCDSRFAASTGNDEADEGYRMVVEWLSQPCEHPLRELAKDYVRAFVGYMGDHASAAYPFESVYLSDKHLLMQEQRDQVLACYHASGLEKDEGWREGEDHIALEFEYMQVLAGRAADALHTGQLDLAQGMLRDQSHFLQDHIMQWVPNFTHDVQRCAMTGFYLGFARVTRGFLACEMELFGELAGVEGLA